MNHSKLSRLAFLFSLLVVLSLPALVFSEPQQKSDNPKPLDFLIGNWEGEGGGSAMQGNGWFSFTRDLQNTVIVRKNHSDFPAANGRPAFAHDDLMVICNAPDQTMKADYYDNEGHIIHYTVTSSKDDNTIVFVSEKTPKTPRFRLTYQKRDENMVSLLFEMTTPDKPDDFIKYIEANAHRRSH